MDHCLLEQYSKQVIVFEMEMLNVSRSMAGIEDAKELPDGKSRIYDAIFSTGLMTSKLFSSSRLYLLYSNHFLLAADVSTIIPQSSSERANCCESTLLYTSLESRGWNQEAGSLVIACDSHMCLSNGFRQSATAVPCSLFKSFCCPASKM